MFKAGDFLLVRNVLCINIADEAYTSPVLDFVLNNSNSSVIRLRSDDKRAREIKR